MSVSAEIFTFPGRNGGGNGSAWGNQDLADVYRCIDQFAQQGVILEAASGISDEGDPWFALEDLSTGEALVHIARIDGFFIVHVMDGETWQGDTLRAALANLDIGALVLGDVHVAGDAGHDGTDKTDPDGSHAFLRIVSAVIAVLTADVIASTVAHDAMASPLPDVSETVAGDHASHNNTHTLAFPDMPVASETEPAHTEKASLDAPDQDVGEASATPTPAHEARETASAAAMLEDVVPTHVAVPQIDYSALLSQTESNAPVNVALEAPAALVAVTVAQPQQSDKHELVHITTSDKVLLAATEKEDLFLVVLKSDQESLQVTPQDFQQNQDSLVVEKGEDTGTSSGIILDLSQIASSQTGGLIVIGQSAAAAELPHGGG
jgi:hypothetical protein